MFDHRRENVREIEKMIYMLLQYHLYLNDTIAICKNLNNGA